MDVVFKALPFRTPVRQRTAEQDPFEVQTPHIPATQVYPHRRVKDRTGLKEGQCSPAIHCGVLSRLASAQGICRFQQVKFKTF